MRVAVVTGANSGIGYQTALTLAKEGILVVLACRNEERAHQAIQKMTSTQAHLKLMFIPLDLNSKKSIDNFVITFKKMYDHLDILVNNAGVLWGKYQKTEDGFERMFGVNYLGHFYLTHQLLPMIPDSSLSRIVTLTSMTYRHANIKFDDLQSTKKFKKMKAYSQSKLANLLFAITLNDQLKASGKKILSIAAHPGIVMQTNIVRHPILHFFARYFVGPIFSNVEQGARPIIEAALSHRIEGGCLYGPIGMFEVFGKVGQSKHAHHVYDQPTALRLWEQSEKLMDISFQVK